MAERLVRDQARPQRGQGPVGVLRPADPRAAARAAHRRGNPHRPGIFPAAPFRASKAPSAPSSRWPRRSAPPPGVRRCSSQLRRLRGSRDHTRPGRPPTRPGPASDRPARSTPVLVVLLLVYAARLVVLALAGTAPALFNSLLVRDADTPWSSLLLADAGGPRRARLLASTGRAGPRAANYPLGRRLPCSSASCWCWRSRPTGLPGDRRSEPVLDPAHFRPEHHHWRLPGVRDQYRAEPSAGPTARPIPRPARAGGGRRRGGGRVSEPSWTGSGSAGPAASFS